jgi:hypothetical protein
MILGFARLLTEMSTRDISGDKARPARKADNLTAIYEAIMRGILRISQLCRPPWPGTAIALLFLLGFMKAVPQLVIGFPLRSPGLDPWSGHARFSVDEGNGTGADFLRGGFSCQFPFHQMLHIRQSFYYWRCVVSMLIAPLTSKLRKKINSSHWRLHAVA